MLVSGEVLRSECENPLQQMVEIWSKSMSSSYVQEPVLESGLKGDGVLYAEYSANDDLIKGFAAGRPIQISSINRTLNSMNVNPDCIRASGNVGIIDITAVRPEYNSSGIGSAVAQKVANELKGACSVVVAEAWLRDSTVDGGNLLESLGFTEIFKSDNYWKPRTDGNYTPCPECDNSPCQCSGALYVMM